MRLFVRDVVLLILSGVLWGVTPSANAMSCPERLAESLCSRIEDEGDIESQVYANVLYLPEARPLVLEALEVKYDKKYIELPLFNSVILRASLEELQRIASIDGVEYIEDLATPIAYRVWALLRELERVLLLHHLGVYDIGVVTLSQGVPRALLDRQVSGERTVRRALEILVARKLPVLVAAGNEGPEPGQVNPWALAQGVFVIGAASERGDRLLDFSSRWATGHAPQRFFVAYGEDLVAPHPHQLSKRPEQIEAEQRNKEKLEEAVRRLPGSRDQYTVVSGTSFAVSSAVRVACRFHMATEVLRARLYTHTPMREGRFVRVLRPFVHAIVDEYYYVIDEKGVYEYHPLFKRRHANIHPQYPGLEIDISLKDIRALSDFLRRELIEADIALTPAALERFWLQIALPVPARSRDEIGGGFISVAAANNYLARMTLADLLEIYANREHPWYSRWMSAARERDVILFSQDQIDANNRYCDENSLALEFDLSR